MPTTCLLCYQQAEYFTLPPCNHTQICWKCCLKLIQGSIFSCPFCKNTAQEKSTILFVDEEEMETQTFDGIFKKGIFKSTKNTYQFYSNENVANFIESQTSNFCPICQQTLDNMSQLKKHLNLQHKRQFCDVCLSNKKCLPSEQKLYSEPQLNSHLKDGEYGESGEIILYHPYCDYCRKRFYDVEEFKLHFRQLSHERCFICEKYYEKEGKYIYYENFAHLQKHFDKSHYVCKQGNCLATKFTNVFVSEEALEEHKKTHKKYKGKGDDKPVMNVMLGFNKNEEDEFEWDKIGRNFQKEFTKLHRNQELLNEEHLDEVIDIRQFYLNIVKDSSRLSLERISDRYHDVLSRIPPKEKQIYFSSVPLFKPLEMSSLTRVELQKFLKRMFQPKFSEPIIQTFFTKRNEYKNITDYYQQIQRCMNRCSCLSYYFAFPQLVRFMKDENKLKKPMDSYYAESLHRLKINRQFIFHGYQRYSDILTLMQKNIQKLIFSMIFDQQINLNTYITYLKDLNINYYNEHHSELFYVPKDHVKNLYHMISKTKTTDFLKMNWLLKVGFTSQSQKQIHSQFYYQTHKQCTPNSLKSLSLKQLALLYLYAKICLQILLNKNEFQYHKSHPTPFFLSNILKHIDHCIEQKKKTQIQMYEKKSLDIRIFIPQAKRKGHIISDEHHPSLIEYIPEKQKKKQEDISFKDLKYGSRAHINQWNQSQSRHLKTPIPQNSQSFPTLSNPAKTKKAQKSEKEEEDFPSLGGSQGPVQNIPKKQKKKNKVQNKEEQEFLNGLFSKKVNPQGWDEEATSKKLKQIKAYQKVTEQPKTENKIMKGKKKIKEHFDQSQLEEALKNSLATFEKQQVDEKKEQKEQKAEFYQGKKKQKEQVQSKKKKYVKKEKKQEQQQKNNPLSLFENLEKEEKRKKEKEREGKIIDMYEIVNTGKIRLDVSSSDDEETKQRKRNKEMEDKKRKIREEKEFQKSLNENDVFESLLDRGNKNEGLVNQIINQKTQESKQKDIKVKKGKKKKEFIESVSIFDLQK